MGQFKRYVDATGHRTQAKVNAMGGWQASRASSKGTHSRDTNWRNPGFAQTDEHPVCLVTWDDSIAFCKWLSEHEHAEYRLPTEAEWEYACRTYSAAIQPTDTASLEQFAWNLPNADMHTWPVGRKRPNAWNLYDMCGNVREWCADWYSADYYLQSPSRDPVGPATGEMRAARGSCFIDLPPSVSAAKRLSAAPTPPMNSLGFRVARSLVAP